MGLLEPVELVLFFENAVIQPLRQACASTEVLSIRYKPFVRHIDFFAVQRAGQAVDKIISDNLALVHSWLEVRVADAYVNKMEEV